MKALVYILVVYFSLGSIFPYTDFSQLLKVPGLITHFELHRLEAQAIGESFSLLDFTLNHFFDPTDHDHAEGGHQNLPLKSFHSFIDFYFNNPQINSLEKYPGVGSTVSLVISELISSDLAKGLFRPPIYPAG